MKRHDMPHVDYLCYDDMDFQLRVVKMHAEGRARCVPGTNVLKEEDAQRVLAVMVAARRLPTRFGWRSRFKSCLSG